MLQATTHVSYLTTVTKVFIEHAPELFPLPSNATDAIAQHPESLFVDEACEFIRSLAAARLTTTSTADAPASPDSSVVPGTHGLSASPPHAASTSTPSRGLSVPPSMKEITSPRKGMNLSSVFSTAKKKGKDLGRDKKEDSKLLKPSDISSLSEGGAVSDDESAFSDRGEEMGEERSVDVSASTGVTETSSGVRKRRSIFKRKTLNDKKSTKNDKD